MTITIKKNYSTTVRFEGIPYGSYLMFENYFSCHSAPTNILKKSMGEAELQMSRIIAGVIRVQGEHNKVHNNEYKKCNNHDILVDEMHFSEISKMQKSPKMDFSCSNKDKIRKQRFLL